MTGVIFTLVITFVVTGVLWFILGSRLKLAEDPEQNDILNLAVYAAALLPIVFVSVFFGLNL